MSQIMKMSNEEKVTMTSLEVVELINNFRLEDGNTVELLHKSFLTSIDTELESLKKCKISQQNILPSTYVNSRGKEYRCYIMNKAGIMQMLNKESALVRYKTQQYIEALENKLDEHSRNQFRNLSPEIQAIFSLDNKQQEQERRITEIEDKMTLNYELSLNIQNAVKSRSVELLGGKDAEAYKKLSKKLFSAFYNDIKRTFRVNSYKNLSVKHYDAAMRFIESWEPKDEILNYAIQGLNSQLAFV